MARSRDKITQPFDFVTARDKERYERQRVAFEEVRREQEEREKRDARLRGDAELNEFRIFGPPGTGKTTKLAAWARIAAEKFGNDAVMIASLTRAAAAEIAGREVPVVKRNVGTMHSLCYRLLERPDIAEVKVASWNEEHPAMALELSVKGDKQDAFSERTGTSWGTQVYEKINLARARMVDASLWTDDMRRFYDAWCDWKGDAALIDFTDMIEHVLEGEIMPESEIRVACFDEVQDFSKLELMLARMWGKSMEYVVLVGDPDQAIFEWRGASARDFLEPAVPEENVRVLEQSYRVPRAVHELASSWIEECSYRFPTVYRPRDCDGSVDYMSNASCGNPYAIVDDVEPELEANRSCMIIMSCGYMLHATIKELRRRGIPFHNPYSPNNGAWNPLRAKGRLTSFLVASMAAFDEQARVWTWAELWQWAEILCAGDVFARCAKKTIKGMAGDESTQNLPPTEHDLSVLFKPEAYDSLRAALGSPDRGDDTDWLAEHTLASKQKLIGYTSKVYRNGGVLALHRDPALIVGTIHSVKGAEADVVYVAPDLSRQGAQQWQGSEEARDAVRRVFYVAFTRARESLVLLGRGSLYGVRW